MVESQGDGRNREDDDRGNRGGGSNARGNYEEVNYHGESRGRSQSGYEEEDESDSSGRRGFAGIDPKERSRISSMGGRASQGDGRNR